MKKRTRRERKEAFRAAYKEELRKQGLLDKVKEVKKKNTKKKEEE